MDHNRVHLVGRLVKDPEYFPAGRRGQEHCVFKLAINRVVPNGEGPVADYVPCSIWGPEAARLAERVRKGDELACLGRIRTNFVQQAGGDKQFFWEVRVDIIDYGRVALKNLRPKPQTDDVTRAVQKLTKEFGG